MKKLVLLGATLLSISLASCDSKNPVGNNDDVMISLSDYYLTIEKFESSKLTYEIVGFDGVPSFETSDESVATVGKDGTVYAVNPGTCTISAIAKDKTATCEVTIISPTAAATLYSEASEVTLEVEDTYTFDLYAIYKGKVVEGATFDIEYGTNEDKDVVEVSYSTKTRKATIKAKSSGDATVIFTSNTRDTLLYKSISISVL